jgi:hypothetical protein
LTAFSTLRRALPLPKAIRTAPARLIAVLRARPGAALPRFFSATGLAVLLAFPPVMSRAEDAQRQTWTVGTGKVVVLAEYYEIQESDCRAMRAPPVVVKTRPTLGKLVINTTTTLAEKPAKCRHVSVPVTRVLYHAGQEPGHDAFGWEIFFQSRELGTRSVQGTATLTRQTTGR